MAGLKDDNTPFISGMDLIGAPVRPQSHTAQQLDPGGANRQPLSPVGAARAQVFAKDFVVAGTCASNLYGLCESFFKPDLVRRRTSTLVLGPR